MTIKRRWMYHIRAMTDDPEIATKMRDFFEGVLRYDSTAFIEETSAMTNMSSVDEAETPPIERLFS